MSSSFDHEYELTQDHFREWLEKYRYAWESASPLAAGQLFTENAMYYETPFGPVFNGRDEIIKYWQEVPDNQENVMFTFGILQVQGNYGYCHWQASFNRKKPGIPVELDGIFEVRFGRNGQCDLFREWWHRKE